MEDYADFHYPAYHRALQDDARETLTAEQWLSMANDTKGNFAYQNFLQKRDNELEKMLGGAEYSDLTPRVRGAITNQFEQEAREYKEYLRDRFPGYTGEFGQSPVGIAERASTLQQVTQLKDLISKNPELVDSNEALYAANEYMKLKAEATPLQSNWGWQT